MSVESENGVSYSGDSESCEATGLVDSVVNSRTSRRGLFGAVGCAVLAAVVSGCAAKLKSVVGDDVLGVAGRSAGPAVPSSSNSAGEVRGGQAVQSSDEICRKVEGEFEVPLDVIARDLPLESRRILTQLKMDEAKADGMVNEAFFTSGYYKHLDIVKRMIGIRYESYLEFRNRATYNKFLEEAWSVTNMMVDLEGATGKLSEAGYIYATVSAGLLRLPVPSDDANFRVLFQQARKKKLCDLKRKIEDIRILRGNIAVSYSQLEDLVPEDLSDIPEVLHED